MNTRAELDAGTARHERLAAEEAGSADRGQSVTRSIALVSILAIAVAAVPLLLIDPTEYEGAAVIVGVFGVPMLASAAMISLVMRRGTVRMTARGALWWPLLVMPAGILLCLIPAMMAHPAYFVVETFWSGVGSVTGMLLFCYAGILCGALLWFFVVFPVVELVLGTVAMTRGEKRGGGHFGAPLFLLPLTAIILVGAFSLDGLLPGKMAAGQLLMALLGIPGSYEVTWEAGLWIVRALVVGVILLWTIPAIRRRRRGRSQAPGS